MRYPRLLLGLLLVALLAPVPAGIAQVDRSGQARLEAEILAGRSNLERQQAEIDAITRELGATEATLAGRIAERDRVSRQLRELELQRDDLQSGITTLRGQVAEAEARVALLEVDGGRRQVPMPKPVAVSVEVQPLLADRCRGKNEGTER
jgi:chromosome segregation ATPase